MCTLKWFCRNTIKDIPHSTGCSFNLTDDHIPLLTIPLDVICDQPVKLQEQIVLKTDCSQKDKRPSP